MQNKAIYADQEYPDEGYADKGYSDKKYAVNQDDQGYGTPITHKRNKGNDCLDCLEIACLPLSPPMNIRDSKDL